MPVLLRERLQQATGNAIAMWSTLATARGDAVREFPGFVAIEGFRRTGLRVMVRTADLLPEDRREIAELTREFRGRPVVVDDPFGGLDLTSLGMTARRLPVMVREPAPVPEAPDVARVRTPAELAAAADIIVRGFPVEDHEPGDAFPPGLVARDGITFFTLGTAGACLTMTDGVTGGAYWVTTLPEYRSQGVGRRLMYAVLRHFGDLPLTLTASRFGKPLYDSLDFVTIGDAHWWS